jgi:hypothetical protein
MVRDSPWTVRGAADGVGVAVAGDEMLEAWSRSKRSSSRTRALRPAVANGMRRAAADDAGARQSYNTIKYSQVYHMNKVIK